MTPMLGGGFGRIASKVPSSIPDGAGYRCPFSPTLVHSNLKALLD